MTGGAVLEGAADGVIKLTEEGLRKLLDDVAKGQGFLPPGAYRDSSGQVWRDVLEPTGRQRKNKQTGRMEEVCRTIRRPVYLTNDTSRDGLIAARKAAARRGMDFYWPAPPELVAVGCPEPASSAPVGWLRGGLKREDDVPVNRGTGAESFEMTFVPIEEPEDIGTSSATMQGVAANESPSDAPIQERMTESPFTDEALADIPVATRRRRGD